MLAVLQINIYIYMFIYMQLGVVLVKASEQAAKNLTAQYYRHTRPTTCPCRVATPPPPHIRSLSPPPPSGPHQEWAKVDRACREYKFLARRGDV